MDEVVLVGLLAILVPTQGFFVISLFDDDQFFLVRLSLLEMTLAVL
jgi:hypothetical protein